MGKREGSGREEKEGVRERREEALVKEPPESILRYLHNNKLKTDILCLESIKS